MPVTLGTAGAVSRAVKRRQERVWRMRERGAPPPNESMDAARQALSDDASAVVTVRGRVHLEIPAVEGTDHAVARGAVGRFVIFTSDGEALVDDDRVAVDPALVVRDRGLVEVTGPARLVLDAETGDYRAVRARLVFDGTSERPLRLRAI